MQESLNEMLHCNDLFSLVLLDRCDGQEAEASWEERGPGTCQYTEGLGGSSWSLIKVGRKVLKYLRTNEVRCIWHGAHFIKHPHFECMDGV